MYRDRNLIYDISGHLDTTQCVHSCFKQTTIKYILVVIPLYIYLIKGAPCSLGEYIFIRGETCSLTDSLCLNKSHNQKKPKGQNSLLS